MNNTYLIQRLLKPYPKAKDEKVKLLQEFGNAFSFGGGLVNGGIPKEGMKLLRDVFRFDYMGSSEFEWGAVPKALAKIVDKRKDYVSGRLLAIPKNIYYLCHKDHEEEVQNRIKLLARDEYKNFRLKERCNLKEALEGKEYHKDIGGWLELENSFMFFIDTIMFSKALKMFGATYRVKQ